MIFYSKLSVLVTRFFHDRINLSNYTNDRKIIFVTGVCRFIESARRWASIEKNYSQVIFFYFFLPPPFFSEHRDELIHTRCDLTHAESFHWRWNRVCKWSHVRCSTLYKLEIITLYIYMKSGKRNMFPYKYRTINIKLFERFLEVFRFQWKIGIYRYHENYTNIDRTIYFLF